MSFLSEFNSDFLTARVTKKGRNSIAKGNFVISYFQIGDSEFDYNSPFNQLTGLNNTPYQKVFSPNDKDTVVKYPYKIDSTQTTTTDGVPVQNSYTQTLRNPMGPAGFVSQYIEYNEDDCTGTKVICTTERIDISTVNGTNTLTVVSGNSFQTCEYITLVFDQFGGTDPNVPIVTGQSNSLIYKVLSIRKQFLGYTTSSGQTINNRATYYNSFDEEIVVQPEEQRILAVIHYSELGDIIFNPERFFKYDDYISNNTNLSDSIIDDEDGIPITDTEYFEVFIPFICYHRNTSNVVGALFRMDTTDYQINTPSPILNGNSSIPFRYLLDEQNYKVGKVFYTKKTIVFDDQELVALLDYRSNRRHTLDAPKLYLVPSDDTPANSLLTGSTNQTIWVSYTFTNSDLALNSMPCNYYSKIQGTTIPTSLVVKFGTNSFRYMKTSLTDIVNGYLATEFKILVQITNTGQYPVPDDWVEVDFTSEAGGDGISFLDKNNIKDKSFILNFAKFNTGGTQFNIENYLKPNYIVREPSNDPKFGEEQPFPGSIRLVRASDIEVMNFLVNLPSTQFTETQNPTYSIGKTKKITEIALLDQNKEPLVVAKTAKPVDRLGTQVFAVKIDF